MSEFNAEEFLQKLEAERKKTSKEAYDLKQMSRLKEVLALYQGEGKVISSHELAEQMKNEPPEQKIMSGIGGLDTILGGFRKRQLVVIAAPTKSGKTSFCIDLTLRLKEENPLWFPFEEGARELIQKFIDRNEEPPLFYTPEATVTNTMMWIEMKIIESIAKFNSNIVFLDHLDFIVPFVADRHDLMIGKTMRDLKGLAKKWDVTIFLIVHLKKTKMEEQPDLEDLRGSASIAQEADTVMLLWRQTERGDTGEVVITDKVNLSVQANRRTGKTGNVKLIYSEGKFLEESWTASEPKSSYDQYKNKAIDKKMKKAEKQLEIELTKDEIPF
jgi:replicative DNA helicase